MPNYMVTSGGKKFKVTMDSPPDQAHIDEMLKGQSQALPESIAAPVVPHKSNAERTFEIRKKKVDAFDPLIAKYADDTGLDPNVIKAMILTESNKDVSPESTNNKSSATGLGQLTKSTAQHLGVTDPTIPDQNIMGTAKYIAENYDRFDGDLDKAVVAYHDGPNAVKQYEKQYGKDWKKGISPEGQEHIARFNNYLTTLGGAKNNRAPQPLYELDTRELAGLPPLQYPNRDASDPANVMFNNPKEQAQAVHEGIQKTISDLPLREQMGSGLGAFAYKMPGMGKIAELTGLAPKGSAATKDETIKDYNSNRTPGQIAGEMLPDVLISSLGGAAATKALKLGQIGKAGFTGAKALMYGTEGATAGGVSAGVHQVQHIGSGEGIQGKEAAAEVIGSALLGTLGGKIGDKLVQVAPKILRRSLRPTLHESTATNPPDYTAALENDLIPKSGNLEKAAARSEIKMADLESKRVIAAKAASQEPIPPAGVPAPKVYTPPKVLPPQPIAQPTSIAQLAPKPVVPPVNPTPGYFPLTPEQQLAKRTAMIEADKARRITEATARRNAEKEALAKQTFTEPSKEEIKPTLSSLASKQAALKPKDIKTTVDYYRGAPNKDLNPKPRDFGGVFFSKNKEAASQYGNLVKHEYPKEIESKLLDLDSEKGKQLIQQYHHFATGEKLNPEDLDQVLMEYSMFPDKKFVQAIESKGYLGLKTGKYDVLLSENALTKKLKSKVINEGYSKADQKLIDEATTAEKALAVQKKLKGQRGSLDIFPDKKKGLEKMSTAEQAAQETPFPNKQELNISDLGKKDAFKEMIKNNLPKESRQPFNVGNSEGMTKDFRNQRGAILNPFFKGDKEINPNYRNISQAERDVESGKKIIAYHGSTDKIDKFKGGTFFSTEPKKATDVANWQGEMKGAPGPSGQNITKAFVDKPEKTFDFNNKDHYMEWGLDPKDFTKGKSDYGVQNEILHELIDNHPNIKSFHFKNVKGGDEIYVRNPEKTTTNYFTGQKGAIPNPFYKAKPTPINQLPMREVKKIGFIDGPLKQSREALDKEIASPTTNKFTSETYDDAKAGFDHWEKEAMKRPTVKGDKNAQMTVEDALSFRQAIDKEIKFRKTQGTLTDGFNKASLMVREDLNKTIAKEAPEVGKLTEEEGKILPFKKSLDTRVEKNLNTHIPTLGIKLSSMIGGAALGAGDSKNRKSSMITGALGGLTLAQLATTPGGAAILFKMGKSLQNTSLKKATFNQLIRSSAVKSREKK